MITIVFFILLGNIVVYICFCYFLCTCTYAHVGYVVINYQTLAVIEDPIVTTING